MFFGYWSLLFFHCCNWCHSLGYLEKQYCRAMLEGKAIDASQALNYYKHMATFFQEAMAGNHSLNVALNLLSKIWNDLLNSRSNREPNFGFLLKLVKKRENWVQGVSCICNDQMRNQIVVHCYSLLAKKKSIVLPQAIHESSTHALIKGVVVAVITTSRSEVCSLCCESISILKRNKFLDMVNLVWFAEYQY